MSGRLLFILSDKCTCCDAISIYIAFPSVHHIAIVVTTVIRVILCIVAFVGFCPRVTTNLLAQLRSLPNCQFVFVTDALRTLRSRKRTVEFAKSAVVRTFETEIVVKVKSVFARQTHCVAAARRTLRRALETLLCAQELRGKTRSAFVETCDTAGDTVRVTWNAETVVDTHFETLFAFDALSVVDSAAEAQSVGARGAPFGGVDSLTDALTLNAEFSDQTDAHARAEGAGGNVGGTSDAVFHFTGFAKSTCGESIAIAAVNTLKIVVWAMCTVVSVAC